MKLFNDDCLKVLPTIPNSSIDLIITSPPYDNIRDYNNSSIWNFDIFKNIAVELQRVLKNNGVIVWIVNDATINGSETGNSFKQALYFKEMD
jgi:DNA modification methylase